MDQIYCPLRDPNMTQEEQANAFPAWVSGYYTKHKPIIRKAMEATSLKDFPSLTEFNAGIQRTQDGEATGGQVPTLHRIQKETLDEISDMGAFVRSTLPILFLDKAFYRDCAHKFIFDENVAQNYFPRVSVTLVSNMQSHGDCFTQTYAIKEMLLKRQEAGIRGRQMQVVPFDGVNHMVSSFFRKRGISSPGCSRRIGMSRKEPYSSSRASFENSDL